MLGPPDTLFFTHLSDLMLMFVISKAREEAIVKSCGNSDGFRLRPARFSHVLTDFPTERKEGGLV